MSNVFGMDVCRRLYIVEGRVVSVYMGKGESRGGFCCRNTLYPCSICIKVGC